MKIFKNKCRLFWCFRKAKKGLVFGDKTLWYCEKHAKIVDDMFKNGEIKSKIPIDYDGLNKLN